MKQHYQGLGHIAIYTEDMEASLAFYEKIGGEVLKRFTATPPEGDKPLALVDLGGVTLQVYPARHPVPAVMLRLEADGRTLCYTGDTNVQDGLADYARGADLLLADGLFTTALWQENKPHLSAVHAAEMAREAGAKRLVITHLNPAIDPETLLREARSVRQDAVLARCGDVYTI